jgi:hypothetical protein
LIFPESGEVGTYRRKYLEAPEESFQPFKTPSAIVDKKLDEELKKGRVGVVLPVEDDNDDDKKFKEIYR